jgi:hypothetical protein
MGSSFARAVACLSFASAFLAFPQVRAAEETPYVGVWVLELRNCGAAQSDPAAPMLVAEDHYDQYQTHCAFKSVEPKDGDFKIAAECTVADKTNNAEFALTVSGDTLTFTDTDGARDLLRCK